MGRTLPQLPYSMQKNMSEIVAMRGINYGDLLQDGDLADSRNLSAGRYPYIATRRAREKQQQYEAVTALTAWEKLVAVQGTDLLYDGAVRGQVTAGAKQFAVVNTKLVIWPDKVYLDLNTLQLHPLAASATVTGSVTFTDSYVEFSESVDLTEKFKAGDGIELSGNAITANNKIIVAKQVLPRRIVVEKGQLTAGSQAGSTVQLSRSVPDMDYICESENRLWGCSGEAQTIYASALGDPTNFNVFSGLSTDSYAVPVGSEGNFTGCCKLSSSVLFWKQDKLHKLLGSSPSEYTIYTYDIEGLKQGCSKSMQVINEVLFYMGLHGIYAYTGGKPSLISANFGQKEFSDAVAGSDGYRYYVSLLDGDSYRLMVYDTRYNLWIQEDETQCIDFARIGKDLYFADSDGSVYLADAGQDDPGVTWLAQFTPFYETVQGRKSYSKLLLRLELPERSYVIAATRQDGGSWRDAGRVIGSTRDTVQIRIPITRCDKFEIRLTGKGPCTILSMLREFGIGSEV